MHTALTSECHIIDAANNHHISLEDALNSLDILLKEIDIYTKSSDGKRNYSVESFGQKDIATTTKGNDTPSLPDELVYLVNFENNHGFAVLAADDRINESVLCITERGSISVGDFVEAFESYSQTFTTKSEHSIEDDFFCNTTREFVAPAILLSNAIQGIRNNECPVANDTRSSLSSVKYGPYTQTKWSQDHIGYPRQDVFNVYTPHNYPAGCVVIAVAQIIMATSDFMFTTTDGTNCYRSSMITVAHCSEPDNAGSNDAKNQAGKFVYNLGNNKNLCSVSYGNETGGTADDAKRALKAFMYSDVTKHLGFGSSNQNIATNQIRKGLPVFLAGKSSGLFAGGHAWVLDGEWGDYYHINWGWNGVMDGYYAKGVFKTSQRVSQERGVDDEVWWEGVDKKDNDYTWTYRLITYSL